MTKLTHSELLRILHYDPETGEFTWKVRQAKNIQIGNKAGGRNYYGYYQIRIDGKLYRSPRLAWFYVYGEWPKDQIDHINRKRDDDRISNLREVTPWQNSQNIKSSHPGVRWNNRERLWRTDIYVNGKTIHLGSFSEKARALEVRREAELKYYPKEAV